MIRHTGVSWQQFLQFPAHASCCAFFCNAIFKLYISPLSLRKVGPQQLLLAPCADWRFHSAVCSRFMSQFAAKHGQNILRPRRTRKLTILNWKGDEVPGFGSYGSYGADGQFPVEKWLQLRSSGWRGPRPCQGSVESLGVPCQTKLVASTL